MLNIRSILKMSSLAFLGALALGLAPTSVQALPPKTNPDPTQSKGNSQPPNPQPNPWFSFNGNMSIDVADRFGTPKSPKKTVKTLNLKTTFGDLWNVFRADMRNKASDFLANKNNTGGRRLYNINVNVAQADKATMFLTIDAKNKQFGLTYVVPGNEIDCAIDVPYLPDPSVRVRFDVMLTMYINCNPAGKKGPLVVANASVGVRNVTVDGDATLKAESFIVSLFTGTDPTVTAQRMFSAAQVNITNKLSGAFDQIDGQLNSFLANPVVTPSYAASRFTLTLSPPIPVATQSRSKR